MQKARDNRFLRFGAFGFVALHLVLIGVGFTEGRGLAVYQWGALMVLAYAVLLAGVAWKGSKAWLVVVLGLAIPVGLLAAMTAWRWIPGVVLSPQESSALKILISGFGVQLLFLGVLFLIHTFTLPNSPAVDEPPK